MQPTHETSYGIIPLRKQNGEYEVFLIHQKSRLGDTFWTFPKGHAEEGESEEVAALRELKEETGLTVQIDRSYPPYAYSYSFTEYGGVVSKEVVYFVGWVEEGEILLQDQEVCEGAWLAFPEARERLTHVALRELFVEISTKLGLSQ